MSVIQWSPAPWGGIGAQPAGLARSFNTPMPPMPLVTRDIVPALNASPTRSKLWEITTWMHCSIIGTCLSTAELRQLLVKLHLAGADVSDHEAHKIGVTIAARHDTAGKLLHKALDTRHRLTINRFAKAGTEVQVRSLWRGAVDSGEIPGAYWAVMTHPASSRVLLGEAFGDIHMLSHLVGAANRADIRRLRDLEATRADLEEQLARQQKAMRDAIVSRDAVIQDLRATLAQRVITEADTPATTDSSAERTLPALIGDLEARLDRESGRRQSAEQKVATLRADVVRERGWREAAILEVNLARADLAAIEQMFVDDGTITQDAQFRLDGMTILYVGGRPQLRANLRQIATQCGAVLLEHDGGIEDNDALLSNLIGRADVVMFPIDCVSHRAVGVVKRGCMKSGRRFFALRTASTSAFMASIARLVADEGKERVAPAQGTA